MEEPRIGLGEFIEVGPLDVLLVADAAFIDAVHQHVHRRLQVNDQIGFGRVHHHALIDSFIERIFRIVQA